MLDLVVIRNSIISSNNHSKQGGEILRKWKIPIAGIYYGLLWNITDTGLFVKDLLTLDQNPRKKLPGPSYLKKKKKNKENLAQFIMDITEYYGILQSIISPPSCSKC